MSNPASSCENSSDFRNNVEVGNVDSYVEMMIPSTLIPCSLSSDHRSKLLIWKGIDTNGVGMFWFIFKRGSSFLWNGQRIS